MPNFQNNTFLSAQTPGGKSWLFGGIGFVLGAVIFFFLGQVYGRPVPIENPFEKTRLGVVGKVVAIGNGALEIEVDAPAFGLAPVRYTAIVDDKTVIKKALFAKSEVKLFETKPSKTMSATLAEIKTGDQAAAKSAVNFWGKNEFKASEIEIRVYQ